MKFDEVEALRNRVRGEPGVGTVLVATGDAGIREATIETMVEDLAERGATRIERVRLLADPPERKEPWQKLAEIAGQPALFGDAYVVVIEECEPSLAPPELKAFLASPAPHVRLVLLPRGRNAEKSGLAKLVREARGEVVAPKDLKDQQAQRLVERLAHERGLRLSRGVPEAVVDLAGTDREALLRAVEALARYKSGEIRLEDLPGLVQRTRKDSPWALDDAIAARNLRLAIKIASRRLEDDPDALLKILHQVARVVRSILTASDLVARKLSDEDAMKAMEIRWEFQWERLRDATKNYHPGELRAFLDEVPHYEALAKRDHTSGPVQALTWLSRLMAPRS